MGREPADPSRGVMILAYHFTLADRTSPYWIDFKGHMSLLEDLGYRVVPLEETAEIVRGASPLTAPTVSLTFDDGWHSNMQVAFPELARRGWPGTVYIATSLIGRRPFMEKRELLELGEMGISVANHTVNHPDLRILQAGEIEREISECNRILQDWTGQRPGSFCYPFGRYSPTARNIVADSGFSTACSGRVGPNPPGTDRFLLRRLTVEVGDRPSVLRDRLAGGMDFLDSRQRYMDS